MLSSAPSPVDLSGAAALLGLEALSFGVALWTLSLGWGVTTLLQNQIPSVALKGPLVAAVGFALLVGLVAGAIGLFSARRTEILVTLSKVASPLLVAPWLPLSCQFLKPTVDPLTLLVFIVVGALGLERCLACSFEALGGGAWPALGSNDWIQRVYRGGAGLVGKHLPLVLVTIGGALYAAYFSYHSLSYHWNGHTSTFDLAIEENIAWNTVHGGPLFASTPIFGTSPVTHFCRHATFVAFVIAPFYALCQRAETLLILQSVLLGMGAVPLFLAVRTYVGPWTSLVLSFAYLLYPPLHGAHLYDFHYLTLAPPFIFALFWSVETRRTMLSLLFLVLTLSVREDVALAVAGMGVYFLFARRRVDSGLTLFFSGALYFVVMKLFIMPKEGGAPSFLVFFEGALPPGAHSFADILKTILLNPVFLLKTLLRQDKVVYALQVLGPLLLLPLRRRGSLILIAPAVLPTLLAQGAALDVTAPFMISFQYTAHWTSCVFIAAAVAIAKAGDPVCSHDLGGRSRMAAATVALMFSALAISYQFGAVLQKKSAVSGRDLFVFGTTPADRTRREDRGALVAQIPPDAKVAASERELPHMANRQWAYTLRSGVYDAQFVLVSFQLPWCREDDLAPVRAIIKDRSFGVVEVRGNFALLERGHSTEKNSALLSVL